jgi:predicted metal-dependent peptidase
MLRTLLLYGAPGLPCTATNCKQDMRCYFLRQPQPLTEKRKTMVDKYSEHMRKVRTARIGLTSNHPFFASLAFGLPIEWDENLKPPTAAVDGERIIFHPDFVKSLPHQELMFLIAHEVMHPALLHILRRGNRCPKRWNVACDIVINYLLIESKVGVMPKMGIHEPELYRAGNGKVEKIYELLPESKEYGEPGSGGNGSMDACLDADPAAKETIAANMRTKLQQAAQVARGEGKMPGSLEQLVEQLTNPKVHWTQYLRNFVMTTRGTDRTWAKRNRRFAALDLMLPGTEGEQMGEVAFAVDQSGSTSDRMVSQAGAEGRSIQEEMRPEKVHVLSFDTKVTKHQEYEPDDPMQLNVVGRGGTCFRTLFEYMAKNDINPECCVVVTDLDCRDFGPEPPFPVLWCVMESSLRYAPWGQVLVVPDDT